MRNLTKKESCNSGSKAREGGEEGERFDPTTYVAYMSHFLRSIEERERGAEEGKEKAETAAVYRLRTAARMTQGGKKELRQKTLLGKPDSFFKHAQSGKGGEGGEGGGTGAEDAARVPLTNIHHISPTEEEKKATEGGSAARDLTAWR